MRGMGKGQDTENGGKIGTMGVSVQLSGREKQCLEEIARGRRVQAISERLSIAPVTVELHLRNTRLKLGASTNPEAVAKAIHLGVIDI